MDISIIIRLFVILFIILIVGLFIWIMVKRNSSTSANLDPITPQTLKSKIAKGGIFFIGPQTQTGQPMVYRDLSNTYYNAGQCSDCPSACAIATQLQDIVKTDCSSGTCKPILVQTAADAIQSMVVQAGKNVMTQVDCAVVLDTNGDPNSTYINDQFLSMLSQDTGSFFVSIWDFISAHSVELLNLGVQFGIAPVMNKVIGEWTICVLLLPGLLGGNSQTQFMTGMQLSVFSGKPVLAFLSRAIRYASQPGVSAAIEEGTLEWDALSKAAAVATIVTERTITESIAETVARIFEVVGDVLGPVFDIVMMIQMIGMFLDMWDPCGLGEVLTANDLTAIGKGFDQAFFNSLLGVSGKVPIEWPVEMIDAYEIICPANSTEAMTSRDFVDKFTFDKLTRNAKDLSAGDCESEWTALSITYTKQYQDSLTVNALGQCIRPLSQTEIDARCSSILGIDVKLDPSTIINSTTNKLDKALSYASLQLANQNTVIANLISQYWWIVALLFIILVIITFML